MALIDALIDADLDYVAVRADSAQEMFEKLTAAAATFNGNQVIVDFELKATGAAPRFLATLLVSSDPGNVASVDAADADFVVVGGVSGIDPLEIVDELQTAIQALGGDTIYKVQVAGGGAGPHWMGAALAG